MAGHVAALTFDSRDLLAPMLYFLVSVVLLLQYQYCSRYNAWESYVLLY